MKKKCLIMLFALCISTWAGVPHSVYIQITEVESGPETGNYNFVAWLEDLTNDILTEASIGSVFYGDLFGLDIGNFNNDWYAGDVLHVKLWEADTPLSEQPIACKDFIVTNQNIDSFAGADGIIMYYPPLSAINPDPCDEEILVTDLPSTSLSWERDMESGAGDNSTSLDVYLSTDYSLVSVLDNSVKIATDLAVSVTSNALPALVYSKNYYWCVVSKNSLSNIEVSSPVWMFSTEDESVVENLEPEVNQSFEFDGGEVGGAGIVPATVNITPPAGSGSAGSIQITKYEEPPASVPCPENALGILFDIDGSNYTGNWPVSVSFSWENLSFSGEFPVLFVNYLDEWKDVNEDSGVDNMIWDITDEGDGFSVSFTTTHFSEWMIGNGSGEDPLPVTLSSFSALNTSMGPQLQWKTLSENNNAGWNIYRSETEFIEECYKVNSEMIDAAGTSSQETCYEFYDEIETYNDYTYFYWLESITLSGDSEYHGPISLHINHFDYDDTPEIPVSHGLMQNFPNPFNPDTSIKFVLESKGRAKLEIFDIKGKKINCLYDENNVEKDIEIKINWDGKDFSGTSVSSGIYLYRLQTNTHFYIKKMIICK